MILIFGMVLTLFAINLNLVSYYDISHPTPILIRGYQKTIRVLAEILKRYQRSFLQPSGYPDELVHLPKVLSFKQRMDNPSIFL